MRCASCGSEIDKAHRFYDTVAGFRKNGASAVINAKATGFKVCISCVETPRKEMEGQMTIEEAGA